MGKEVKLDPKVAFAEKGEKTYKELLELVEINNWAQKSVKSRTKSTVKLGKIVEKLKFHLEQYNEKLSDIKLDLASTDKEGNLIVNEKTQGYAYTKEAEKKFKERAKELLNEKFEFNLIQIIDKVAGKEDLGDFHFLEGWVSGLEFNPKDELDNVEL